MFRMNKESEEILEGGSLNKRQLAAQKRQRVYKHILEHSDVNECKQLAEAAGYDMSDPYSDEYQSGSQFISSLIRNGYITKQIGRDGETYFYIGNKETVEAESPVKTSPAVEEAQKILEDALDEYEEDEMGPEGQSKEDWATDDPIDDFPGSEDFLKTYDGCLEIADPNNHGNKIIFEFKNKSHCDIVNIIENLNMEDLL